MLAGSTTAPLPDSARFGYVDALRGWAFLGVLFTHTPLLATGYDGLSGTARAFIEHGQYGVQLFFVVSAFTLFRSIAQRAGRDPMPVASFFVRRLFRIAPMFYAGIVFYTLYYGTAVRTWSPVGIGGAQLLTAVAFLHGWHPATVEAVVPGGWSVAVEMCFYLVVPVLFVVVRTPNRAVVFFAVSFVVALTVYFSKATSRLYPDWVGIGPTDMVRELRYKWLPNQLPVFALGIVLYFLNRSNERESGVASIFVTLGAVLCLAGTPFLPDHVLFSVGFVLLAHGLARHPVRAVVNRLTRHVGTISFSAYLTHFAVLDGASWAAARLPSLLTANPYARLAVVFALALAGTVAVATVTYHLIERPGQALGAVVGRRLMGRLRPVPSPEPFRDRPHAVEGP